MEPYWYRNAIIYEVEPALFRDADGNGWGDLCGITERLPYLRGLGVTCLWVLPFFPSPFQDDGYDVTDYLDVDPRFGTLADFTALVEKARELGIRVIVDLVLQHTSREHPWFQAARLDRGSRYREYYIWSDRPRPTSAKPIFPTVEDSVWTWDEAAGQYYQHVFYAHEPDLNMASARVRREIKRIMSFWLQLGVSGFRVDAASHMVEAAADIDPRDNRGFWLLEELREHVAKRHPDAVLLGEADVPPHAYADYFGQGDRLTMVASFWLNNYLFLALARQRAEPLVRALHEQPVPPDAGQYAVWVRNHDELDLERLGEEEREEVMRAFAPDPCMRIYGRGIRRRLPPMLGGDPRRVAVTYAIVMSLPGSPILRYGEEIGMGEDLCLPERRAVRTAMQWSDEPYGGFSAAPGIKPSVPIVGTGPYRYQAVNVGAQVLQEDSLLARIGKMVRARLELPEICSCPCHTLDAGHPGVLALRYRGRRGEVLALANLSPDEVALELPGFAPEHLAGMLADSAYAEDALYLRGYGYRWFRVKRTS